MMFAARSLLLLFFGSALFLVIRLAMAEADFRLDPATALDQLAWTSSEHLARFGSSTDRLRAAVKLNPHLTSAWIQLGLNAEADGNLLEAEGDLLRAAEIDHLYVPSWTLANFYFRRGDSAGFWLWAASAARLTYDDYRPLLRLADALEESPQEVAVRLGGGAPMLRAYLDLLINAHRPESAREIAHMLAERHDPADRDRLAPFADLP